MKGLDKRAIKFYTLSCAFSLPIIILFNLIGTPPFLMLFAGGLAGLVSAPLALNIIRYLEDKKKPSKEED